MSPEGRWITIGNTEIPNRRAASGGRHALESEMREMGGILSCTIVDVVRPCGTIDRMAPLLVPERFSIGELVARSGVPAATIHHYLRLGLLPSARRSAPNRFLYDERPLQALGLIRVLGDRRGLPLPVIRRVLPDLLGLDQEQAFRPEMWDRAVGVHAGRGGRRTPAARLLDAAVDAFSRRGYADVNVDEICRAARIAKGSFYRHYRSKEELFLGAAESLAEDVVASFKETVGLTRPSPEEGAEILVSLIEPPLPVFLDLLARSLQGRAGYTV